MPRLHTHTVRQTWTKENGRDRLRLVCPFEPCEFACFGDDEMEEHLASAHPAGCLIADFAWLDVNGKFFAPDTAILSNKILVEEETGTSNLQPRTCVVSAPFLPPVLHTPLSPVST